MNYDKENIELNKLLIKQRAEIGAKIPEICVNPPLMEKRSVADILDNVARRSVIERTPRR